MKPVVFVGPTLPSAIAETYLDATYLPPASQGDVLAALYPRSPQAIALIDGYFLQSLAVWHKEILAALDRGIPVYGSSSLGALRAAETARYGMRGVGRVFEMYWSGVLKDDDEVALAHAGPEDDYRGLSFPMVNVRATLERACADGLLDPAWHAQAVDAAKAIYFPGRTLPAIVSAIDGLGAPASVGLAVEHAISTRYVDVKRADAIELLTLVRNELDHAPPRSRRTRPRRREAADSKPTYHLRILRDRDRKVHGDHARVSLSHIAETAALHMPGFPMLSFHCLNRAVACVFAEMLGVQVGDAELADEEAQVRRRLGIESDQEMASWMESVDIGEEELKELLREQAMCRALHRWYAAGHSTECNTRRIVDDLRLSGEYDTWRRRASLEAWFVSDAAVQAESASTDLDLDGLLREHRQDTGIALDWADRADENGFECVEDFRIALLRAHLARRAKAASSGELR